ncbi:MAG: hypothetical protein ACT4O5_13840 [Gammaproteobacteria bacterium]
MTRILGIALMVLSASSCVSLSGTHMAVTPWAAAAAHSFEQRPAAHDPADAKTVALAERTIHESLSRDSAKQDPVVAAR